MISVDHAVKVRVPASSANLGPGYDSFGLALARYDEVVAARAAGSPRIEVSGRGADTVSLDDDHLVYRSAQLGFRLLGEPEAALELVCRNEIPHGGGQGSSAAAIVAGLAVARELTEGGRQRMSDRDLLDAATAVEGHPDNVAPAVLGGFTVAWMDDHGHAGVIKRPVHPDVRVLLLSAHRGASTDQARAVLPATIPHADAAANSAAAALLVHALSDEPALLLDATRDRLHQQYRAAVLPDTTALLAELRAAGVPAVVSGAGPSIVAFVLADSAEAADPQRWARPGFDALLLAVDQTGLQVGPV